MANVSQQNGPIRQVKFDTGASDISKVHINFYVTASLLRVTRVTIVGNHVFALWEEARVL